MSDLVKINKKGKSEKGVSRRDFLKLVGASAALGAAGCADKSEQKIYPYVHGQNESIPGVASWYSSTCNECPAGCGINVRVREGRAVKIEGNKDHPINRGGLCALGQAALQGLYDPDRVREPLKRDKAGNLTSTSWDSAYKKVGSLLAKNKGKAALITGEVTGSLAELIKEWTNKFGIKHVVYDPLSQTDLAEAAEKVYGVYGVPEYRFDRADVVLNFGADFLETWVSPVQYARDWAKKKRSAHPALNIHIEPRLSLTGASADMWLSNAPGSELKLALAIMKELVARGSGDNLQSDVLSKIKEITADISLSDVSNETGIKKEKILLIVDHLHKAKHSLVVAGGAATATNNGKALHTVVHLINSLLKNVGHSVILTKPRTPQSSLSDLADLVSNIEAGEIKLLLVYGANPAYSLPASHRFPYALKKIKSVVSFSSIIDETAEFSNLILPASTSLESWGDAQPLPGVFSLMQPVMSPVFNTHEIGDQLLTLAGKAGAEGFAAGHKRFKDFLQAKWKQIHSKENVASGFEKFWVNSLEKGGHFSEKTNRVNVKIDRTIFNQDFSTPKFEYKSVAKNAPIFYPFASVKSFDGRAANRPWLHEVPDPITQLVWEAWAELHPDTAKHHNLKQGDLVTVRNYYGEITVPVYVTEHVHPGIVAVPLGHGHTSYGRYAKMIGGGNAFSLLAKSTTTGSLPLLSSKVSVTRARGKSKTTNVQGSDYQLDRDLARTKYEKFGDSHKDSHAHDDHAGGHGAGHHEPMQMYEQRVHPLYDWVMAIDLAACTGCSACVVACSAENNIPFVGKKIVQEGREMSWLRIERYFDETPAQELKVSFLPMLCQQCNNAPCEPVCPVYATYHNEEGLNAMIYNRCVGTRYCSNNCTYKVRRFNWYEYTFPEPLNWQLNPDVTQRIAGVMEKCTFCIQRINAAKDNSKDLGRPVLDGEVEPACVQSCPTQALTFGNKNNPTSKVHDLLTSERGYKILDHHINTQPSITYLEDVRYKV